MNFKDYVQVQEAMEILEVSRPTIYKWEKKGMIKGYRHPTSGWHLFLRSDLEEFKKTIAHPIEAK